MKLVAFRARRKFRSDTIALGAEFSYLLLSNAIRLPKLARPFHQAIEPDLLGLASEFPSTFFVSDSSFSGDSCPPFSMGWLSL